MMRFNFVWFLLFWLFITEMQAQTTDSIEKEIEDPRPSGALPFDPHRDNFTLAGLASKTWEGPYYQDAMLGSVVYVPCSLKPHMNNRLYKQRQLAAEEKHFWSVLWVHQNWDSVVDPWLGDGRRSYDTLQVVPYWEPDMSAHLEQARLTILDANPTDNGVYACVVAMYPLEKGLSPVILSQSDLVSVHFVRIKSGHTTGPECKNEDAEKSVYCQTGFEAFTHHVYYPSGSRKGDVLFQAECNADIFLTALSLGDVDPTFWSIGWRFVPQHTFDDTRAVEVDAKLEMQFESPVHICHPGATVPCMFTSETDRERPKIGARDLALAQKESIKLWKARWLLLTGTKQQTSGRWQCWVQGLGITTHPKTSSIPVRWFVDELHIKIIPEKDLYSWWTTVEFWRVLGLVAAPSVFLLFGLIMAVGRTAAYLYPDKIPPRKRMKLLLGTASEAQSVLDEKDDIKEEFEPYAYLHAYLNRQGIESYQTDDQGGTSKVNSR